MTDRGDRERLVGLSVLAVSSLALAASWLVVVNQDQQARAFEASAPEPTPQGAVSSPPVQGLRPVAPARKRVVVVRRSRAS